MIAVLCWIAFIALFLLSRLRLHQTSGTRDRIALILFVLGGVAVLATGFLVGWISALVMLACWFVLPLAAEPMIARMTAKGPVDTKSGAAQASKRERMGRLNRGEMSLGEFFQEGRQDDAESRRKMETLAARSDVSAVLTRNRVSLERFIALREQLALVPELEWRVLGSPTELDRLIQLVAAAKSPAQIAATFRGSSLRRPA